MKNLILVVVFFGLLGFLGNGIAAETEARACAIELSKRKTIESEIEKYQCKKGSPLYLTETQWVGMTLHSVYMAATRVCDYDKTISNLALQSMTAASCVYTGKVLPLYGAKKLLRQADLKSPK